MSIHHRINGKYLHQYANEMAWRGNPFPPLVNSGKSEAVEPALAAIRRSHPSRSRCAAM
jgi:hypothetical protein